MTQDTVESKTLTPEQRETNDFNGGFSNQNMHHTSKEHLKRLNSAILKATFVGALYGGLISIPTELLIRWRSPLYRAFGWRIRMFYHTIWIASAAAFHAEREVIRFENIIRQEEAERRNKLLELSIMQGVYTPESEGFKSKRGD
ncbi:hypothetical protein CAS74_002905 [Pichia kudriavzevii]|uniref:Uncharacterized protein n=1 Tax=Pichia kudriavzevii TaxID=4909 RepID=A0A099P3M4_PICKU|nr:uncharacterized protein C5L36_0E03380 [Pichia kudriavzevii]AWU78280.1 hypothetical protein C5L36_0E03380 [Pichia kudriavzevii]KGK39520.1 hypothetical protein JL09_g1325 [Pichia kudriavzevii]ONH77864.1 hypothetical protein BOH78_0037 [Pichia kudriavzevii]OUT21921.1 hypothetical protein CAS74_002905 [Pichia kudriavzevii]